MLSRRPHRKQQQQQQQQQEEVIDEQVDQYFNGGDVIKRIETLEEELRMAKFRNEGFELKFEDLDRDVDDALRDVVYWGDRVRHVLAISSKIEKEVDTIVRSLRFVQHHLLARPSDAVRNPRRGDEQEWASS